MHLPSRARICAALLITGAAMMVAPSSAGAATVFGADMTQSPAFSTSSFSITNVIKADGSIDTGAPVSGVLVSVRIKTNDGGGTGAIRVLTETSHPDASTWGLVNTAPDIPVTVTADATPEGHITEVLTRRPIAAGQRLGWQIDDLGGNIQEAYHDPGNVAECAFRSASHPFGTSLDYSTAGCNHNPVLLSGTIEADGDGDGFGDETQDQCPTSAAVQTACPPAALAPPAAKKKKCKKAKKRSALAAKKKKCKKRKK